MWGVCLCKMGCDWVDDDHVTYLSIVNGALALNNIEPSSSFTSPSFAAVPPRSIPSSNIMMMLNYVVVEKMMMLSLILILFNSCKGGYPLSFISFINLVSVGAIHNLNR